MVSKPIKLPELHYPMIQLFNNSRYKTGFHDPSRLASSLVVCETDAALADNRKEGRAASRAGNACVVR